MLGTAAGLLFLIGVVHSVLGERFILIPLFRLNKLPRLKLGDGFFKGTLRFVWHLLTIAWWGIAAMLLVMSAPSPNATSILLYIVSLVFLASGLMSAGFTKGVHLSWIVFFAISFLCACKAFTG
jgi:hypothetical protein